MAAGRDSAVIDAGGGASLLAGRLAAAGFTDVTVVDVSAAALAAARRRPGGDQIAWINADLLAWRPPQSYQIWHDRAVFHFLTSPADRAAYLDTLLPRCPAAARSSWPPSPPTAPRTAPDCRSPATTQPASPPS